MAYRKTSRRRTARPASRRAGSGRRTYSARRPARSNGRLRRSTGGYRSRDIRIVIEQTTASPVSRPTMLAPTVVEPPKKSTF